MTLKQKQKMLGNGENLWVHPLDNRDLLDVSNRANLGTNTNLKSEMSSSFLLFNLSFIVYDTGVFLQRNVPLLKS